jgi:hypothetical protein
MYYNLQTADELVSLRLQSAVRDFIPVALAIIALGVAALALVRAKSQWQGRMGDLLKPRRIVGLALILAALAGLYPPWEARVTGPGSVHPSYSCGYAPLWSPPVACGEVLRIAALAHVELGRLLIEWVILGSLTGGLIALGTTKGRDHSDLSN